MDLIQETYEKSIVDDWDFFRHHFWNKEYSHEDLINLHEFWYAAFPNQQNFKILWAKEFFDYYKNSDGLKIIELGCWGGELANIILQEYKNIESWYGYDICLSAIKNNIAPSSFNGVHLDIPFYDKVHELNQDIFISTHTLEHLSNEDIPKILNVIHNSSIKYIFLEIPLLETGQDWEGSRSAHVMTLGRNYFRKWFINYNWRIKKEWNKRKNWAIWAERV